jgi:hypothetical protein
MRQQIGRTIQVGPLPRCHGLTEVLGKRPVSTAAAVSW